MGKGKGDSYLRISSIRTLYGYATFLTALNTLVLKEDERVAICATNGVYFYYNPLKIIDLFQKNAVFLNRSFYIVFCIVYIVIFGLKKSC